MTSEGKKNESSRKVEIQDAIDPDDIEILRDDVEDEDGDSPEAADLAEENIAEDEPDWLKKLDSSEEEKSPETESGKKKPKKASKAEIAEHLARKNEMLQKLHDRLSRTEKDLEIKEDRLMRLAAEFENYKKRTRQEWELLKNQANAGLLQDILGILDDLDRAFEHSGDSVEHFRDGVTLIHSSLLDLLGRNGLSEIATLGQPFDPQYHEALAEMPSDEIEAGVVAEVVQKGYMLYDQVIRPARVVVSKGNV